MSFIPPFSVYLSIAPGFFCPCLLELFFSLLSSILPRRDRQVVVTPLLIEPNPQPQPLINLSSSTRPRPSLHPRKLRLSFLGRHANGVGSGGREPGLTNTNEDRDTHGTDRAGGRDSGHSYVSMRIWGELCHGECVGG